MNSVCRMLLLLSLSSGLLIASTGSLHAWQSASVENQVAESSQLAPAVASPQSANSPSVFGDRVKLDWPEDGDTLLYSVNAADGAMEHFRVDLSSGDKVRLFDPEATLPQLKEHTGESISVDSLREIRNVTFDETKNAVVFRFRDQTFEIADDGVIAKTDAGDLDYSSLFSSDRRSSRGQGDLNMRFVNETSNTIEMLWRSTSGQLVSYGKVKPGKVGIQNTFIGHVWTIADEKGKELARIKASVTSSVLNITPEFLESYQSYLEEIKRTAAARGWSLGADERNASDAGQFRIVDHNLVWTKKDGEKVSLSTSGTESDRFRGPVMVSPDNRFVAAVREKVVPKRKIEIVQSSPGDQLQPKVKQVTYVKPGDPIDQSRVCMWDLESGEEIEISNELFDNPWRLRDMNWLNDSSRFVFVYNQRGHQALRVLAVDPATGKVQAVVNEESKTFIDYNGKYFFQLIDDGNELLWMSERDGFNHLYRVSSRTGEVLNQVTKHATDQDQWVVRKVVRVDEEQGQVWFSASGLDPSHDPYYEHLCRVDFDGENFVILTAGDGQHDWEFSPDRKWIVDRFSRVDMPVVTNLRSAIDGSEVCKLAKADCSNLIESGWTLPERFVAKGRDGVTDIYGIIVFPKDYDPGQKYPVVEQIYAGPHSSHVPKSFSTLGGQHRMADNGFILVQIDGMGTSNRSKAFHDVAWKNLADAGFPDRIAWIKSAAEKHKAMDLSRVGIYGGSAGGQNAMRALLDHNDFYHVAVADCGCHDNRMDKIWWNELWMSWPVDKSYEESSNVVHANRLEGKLLLVVGELDTNVDPASTMQVVDALVKADKDFELLVVPGAGHGAAETRYGSRRRTEFLKRHLLTE